MVSLYNEINEYWEDQNSISLLDKNLRELEESVILPCLKQTQDFADIGCGDGISTVKYARRVKSCLALEPSNYLRSKAKQRFAEERLKNVRCVQGSVLDLSEYQEAFDVVVTQRVLINLPTWEDQKRGIDNIYADLRPGGYYVMIENTYEGHEALNSVRRAVGLADIPLHWHNLFFHHDQLIEHFHGKFMVKHHATFDLYYFLTRVFVTMFAKFEGYGKAAKKDDIFNVTDAAAKRLFETVSPRIRVGTGPAFGPIQGFVLRKIA